MTTVEGAVPSMELGIKRFCMPGVVLRSRCPKCGEAHTEDFGETELPYPYVGKPFPVQCYCRNEGCDHEWSVAIRLDMIVSVVDPEVTP